MITALVQFKLPQPISRKEARDLFSSTTPKYQDLDGLIRKYYLLSQNGQTAGGVYLWNSKANAERLYTDEWKQFIFEKYGTPPSVTFFDTPVIIDNVTGKVVLDED